MKQSNLIIITGAPGVGKTTIAQHISKALEIPLLCKDEIKERLHDAGMRDNLGPISFESLYIFASNLLRSHVSAIIEGNFRAQQANNSIGNIQATYNCNVIQIFVTCSEDVRKSRITERVRTNNRHAVHIELDTTNGIQEKTYTPLDIPSTVITIDYTKPETVDLKNAIEQIKSVL